MILHSLLLCARIVIGGWHAAADGENYNSMLLKEMTAFEPE
jgi:hypothetical protein